MKFSTSLFALLLIASIGFAQAAVSIDVTCKDFASIEMKLKLEAPDDLFLTAGLFDASIGIPVEMFDAAEMSKQFKLKNLPAGFEANLYVREGKKFYNSTDIATYNLHVFITSKTDDESYTIIMVDDVLQVMGSLNGGIVVSPLILQSSFMDSNVAKGEASVSRPGEKTSNKVLCQFK